MSLQIEEQKLLNEQDQPTPIITFQNYNDEEEQNFEQIDMPQWSVLISNDDIFQLTIASKVISDFKIEGHKVFGEVITAENG